MLTKALLRDTAKALGRTVGQWYSVPTPQRIVNSMRSYAQYAADLQTYLTLGGAESLNVRDLTPRLHDRTTQGAALRVPFFQSAWMIEHMQHHQPEEHVDVGSDINLLAAMAALLENVTFIDLRPLELRTPGLFFRQGSILEMPYADQSIASLSCLHVIEHIGLGRYGDPLDPDGSLKAARELSRVLAPGGLLYISTPVGQPRTCFNAHRIFSIEQVCAMFAPLKLVDLAGISDNDFELQHWPAYEHLNQSERGLGLFVFTKETSG